MKEQKVKQIILSALVILSIAGCNKDVPIKSKPAKHESTVILGTYEWDAETNTLGSSPKSDFWWEQVNATEGNLVAQNGATIEVVRRKDFYSISKSEIVRLPALRDGRISHQYIVPGTVALFKTAEGNYGKLIIRGYRTSHDFEFDEARDHLSESFKKFALSKPNIEKYNLSVEYILFK